MRLNLNDIIERPGGSVPFACGLSGERLLCPSVARFSTAPRAEGAVRNSGGVLTLEGIVTADMVRICDRCGREFAESLSLPVSAQLAADLQDEDNPDIFPVDADGGIDPADIIETCFILNMEATCLCRPDCAGLCPRCGADLNDGPCSCRAQTDPRLAVLGQLLDIDENK